MNGRTTRYKSGNSNDKQNDIIYESYMDTISVVYVFPYLYFVFGTHKRYPSVKKRKKRSLMLTPWMVIPRFGLPRSHVSHTVRYCYNEQQVLRKSVNQR